MAIDIDSIEDIYPRLVAGEPRSVLSVFSPRAKVDAPLSGRQEPIEWALDTSRWLARHAARYEAGTSVVTDGRLAHEYVIHLVANDAGVALPVLLVADIDGDLVRDLRIYHSTWPLNGGHALRGPLREPDPGLALPEPLESYERALAAGDVDALQALFEPDGYVREPAGDAFRHAGEAREEFYGPLRSKGGVRLRPVTVTDDGHTAVLEYLCDEWGGTSFPPQAGAAVWERSASGLIAGVSIYDDIMPPEGLFD